MIKKCMNTGLKYLCKTTSNVKRDPYEYKGSGKYWLKHIKKHKSYIVTCVIGEFDSKEDLIQQGTILSEQWNIVQSTEWANLVPERGDGGWIHNQTGNTWICSNEAKANMRKSRQINKDSYDRGRTKSIPKISGGNNYQSTCFIHTPWGTFETYTDAIEKAKELRRLHDRTDVITDISTLRKYCEQDVRLNPNGRRTFQLWRGQYTKQLGFYKEKKH